VSDTATTRILARIAGPFVAASGLAVAVRRDAVVGIVDGLEHDPALVFVLGIFTLLIGVILLVFHNRWGSPVQAVLSLLGWLSVIRGLVLLFVPDLVLALARPAVSPGPAVAAGLITLLIGLWLSYEGYVRKPVLVEDHP
jgi:uncharacterized membrane protein HdeD (DUF308 family)